MLTFRRNYFLLTILLFFIEVFIALYLHDPIIRPYVGDYLVVMLIYCFVRSFFNVDVLSAAIGSLLFAYLVEFGQYLNLVAILGLQNSRFWNTILGNLFEWIDMVAYTLGIATVLLIEKLRSGAKRKKVVAD